MLLMQIMFGGRSCDVLGGSSGLHGAAAGVTPLNSLDRETTYEK